MLLYLLSDLFTVSWGFPHSQSVGSKVLWKPSPCQPPPPVPCSFDSCVTQITCFVLIHAKQISDLNRFERGYFSTNSDGDNFVFLFAQQESPGLIKTWRLKKSDLIWPWIEAGLRKTSSCNPEAVAPSHSRRLAVSEQPDDRSSCSSMYFLWVSFTFEPVLPKSERS